MPRPISNEKREAIIKYMKEGKSKTEIAKWLSIDYKTVMRVWKTYQETGTYTPRVGKTGRKPLVSEAQMEQVFEKIKEQPNITLKELIEMFELGVSQAALSKRLTQAGWTFEKRQLIRMDYIRQK